MKDNVGVLLPVSALPGRHGIGDFGNSAYLFINWLHNHHYKYWQVLPLNPLGPGFSPYMSTCSEAIDTRYISLDVLAKEGLIKEAPSFEPNTDFVHYYEVERFKEKYFQEAYQNYKKGSQKNLKLFKKNNPWVIYFSYYLLLREKYHDACWNLWDEKDLYYFDRHDDVPAEYEDECGYTIFLQMKAYQQWNRLWKYAHDKGISIIADCPFYVGIDSADAWLNKDYFLMDEKYHPTLVSGCPPDAFSDDGQLWGTPIYNFAKMKEDNYSFLVHRIGYLATTCDILRLDHFRAWDTYCVIPSEDTNARRGQWWQGPREDFFDTLHAKYPNINIIAEDLGELFPSVLTLRDHYNLPGMFIIQFTIWDGNWANDHQIVYPGTHDNQTLYGFIKSLNQDQINFMNWKFNNPKDLYKCLFDYTWNMPSLMTIIPLQDLLKLDDSARMNTPSTLGSPNWCWRLKDMSWRKKIKFGNL